MFTMKRHTERRQEQSSFLVVCRSRTYEDVDSGDHFRGVAVCIKFWLAKTAFNIAIHATILFVPNNNNNPQNNPQTWTQAQEKQKKKLLTNHN